MAVFNTRYTRKDDRSYEWFSPMMTSYDTPSPYKVTASDIYRPQFQAYYAFDGNPQTAFHSSNIPDSWIQLDLGKNVVVNGVRITAYAIADGGTGYLATPKVFTLYGSLDGSDWRKVYESDGTKYNSVSFGEVQEYMFPAVSYRYYKLVSHLNYQNNYFFTASDIEFSKMAETTAGSNAKSAFYSVNPANAIQPFTVTAAVTASGGEIQTEGG